MGLSARREDQPAVLLLCTRARAAIKHYHAVYTFIYIHLGVSRSLVLVFLVWAVFAAVVSSPWVLWI